MSKTFDEKELKEVGRIKVSARGLRDIANRLEQKTGSDTVVNLLVYLTPGETPTDYPDLGYDFTSISTEPKKVEEKPPETKVEEQPKPVVEETKKTEEKPAEAPKAEEPKVAPAVAETPTPQAQETPAPVANKELEKKAEEIKTEANTQLNTEQK